MFAPQLTVEYLDSQALRPYLWLYSSSWLKAYTCTCKIIQKLSKIWDFREFKIITGSGAITSWTLNNTLLPTGMSFGSTNGTLYGTATQLWVRTSYKVWANNSGGSVVAYFNLTVNDQIPSGITYTPENVTLTKNIVSSDLPLAPSKVFLTG